MYLSRLKLDPRHHTSRELRLNHYLLHQAIFRAFPEANDGGPGRILYRLDSDRQGNINLLVQSEKEPDWSKAIWLSESLLEPEAVKTLEYQFQTGQTLYFLLRANPTIKKATSEGSQITKRQGLLKEADQLNWLKRKSEGGGFIILTCRAIPEGIIHDEKNNNSGKLRHYAVRFEGVLKVVAPELFKTTIEAGIGSAKGFGYGLLSIAPVRG